VAVGAGRPGLGRGFALLLSASSVSTVGNGLAAAAFPLLATRLTSDPFLVSVVMAAGTLPWLVFGLLSGAIVDRTDRRVLMWRTDAARAVIVGGLVVTVATGGIDIWALALFAAAIGVGTTLFDNASQAMVPALVGVDDEPLGRANARLYGSEVVGEQFAGPALGGLCFAAAESLPFALDAVTFALSAALVAGVSGRYRPTVAASGDGIPGSFRRAVAEGVTWLARHHFLRALMVAIGATNLAIAMGEAVLVLLAERRFGVDAAGYGVLLATLAVGGFTASAVVSALTRRWHRSVVLRGSLVLLPAGILLAGLAPDAYICGVGLAVVSFAAVLFSVAAVSLRQALIPDALMGRVVSVFRVVGMGATPVGALLGGLVARLVGLRAPYVVAAVLIAAVAVLTWPLLSRRSLDHQRAVG
jgi:MFS family permease